MDIWKRPALLLVLWWVVALAIVCCQMLPMSVHVCLRETLNRLLVHILAIK